MLLYKCQEERETGKTKKLIVPADKFRGQLESPTLETLDKKNKKVVDKQKKTWYN